MTRRFKLRAPVPGSDHDDDRATTFSRITELILGAAAGILLVALLLAGELRLTPEQRIDLLQTTTYAAP